MINFELKEFACPCCGKVEMEPDFLEKVDLARTLAGVPFVINSGYRCEKHNREVGSTSMNHTSGRAADIKCLDSGTRWRMINGLIQAEFKRIGMNRTFIHVDNMDELGSLRAIWYYG